MGKTLYPDTNNQYAYRIDRAGFLARIRSKAETLWIDGYRVQVCYEPDTFLVYNEEEGIQAGYKVNPVTEQCTCKFHTDQYTHPLEPANPGKMIACKHQRGLKSLLAEEVSYWKAREQQAELNGSTQRAARYVVIWDALEIAWRNAMANRARRRAA